MTTWPRLPKLYFEVESFLNKNRDPDCDVPPSLPSLEIGLGVDDFGDFDIVLDNASKRLITKLIRITMKNCVVKPTGMPRYQAAWMYCPYPTVWLDFRTDEAAEEYQLALQRADVSKAFRGIAVELMGRALKKLCA